MNFKILATACFCLLSILALAGFWVYLDTHKTYRLTVAAGSPSGEAFAMSSAIAEITRRYHPNIKIEVYQTSGSTENMRLLDKGLIDLATVQADTKMLPNARLIALLYPDTFQLVAREGAGIKTVSDLRGKRIALPPKGGGQIKSFWFLAEHYGLKSDSFIGSSMSQGAAVFAMRRGAVDAMFSVRAAGNRRILELIETSPARLISIDQAGALKLKQPALDVGVIPKGSYRGEPALPDTDLPSVNVQRLLVARAGLDSSVVATLTSILFERRRDLIDLTSLAGFIASPDQTGGTALPVHPGAQQFYNREEPTFLQEQAEPIALIVSILAIIISGILRITAQRKKRRIDQINRELLDIYHAVTSSTATEELTGIRNRMMQILDSVVDGAEIGEISHEGLEVLSFTWEAVNNAITEMYDVVADEKPSASPQQQGA